MKSPTPQQRYTRDRDRILGSKAFRRLAGKTQVVALARDPLIRTRLTHTLEVSSIARSIGEQLGLMDSLVDAIALGHDLGHPAFGHAGERALAALVPGGFHHAAQGVRVVTELEPELELAPDVVEGILKHSKGRAGTIFARGPSLGVLTREALAVRAADLFAYACHDLDDAYRLGALDPSDLPAQPAALLGRTPAQVRQVLVSRTVRASRARGDISLDVETEGALQALRAFLYERLYEGTCISSQTAFVRSLFESIWESAERRRDAFDAATAVFRAEFPETPSFATRFVDVIAAMTDRQVLELGGSLALPRKVRSFPDVVFFAPPVSVREGASRLNASERGKAVAARDS